MNELRETTRPSREPRKSWGARLGLALAIAFALHSGPTLAATLHVEGGQLLGAFGVDVGGTLYDVEFVDGTCVDSFAGCDEAADFTFTTTTGAGLASAALQNQVFLDAAEGAFDSVPELTAGCESNAFFTCRVTTPVARSFDLQGNPLTTVTVVSISNGTLELNDLAPSIHAELVTDGMGDAGSGDFRVYARWSLSRFEACSDGGTVADTATGLLWERKTGTPVGAAVICSTAPGGCPDRHDVNNRYLWSSTGTAADGNAYTDFLFNLNAGSGFAGHTDWRLPVMSELQSIMVGPGVLDATSLVDPPDPAFGDNVTHQTTTCTTAPCIDPRFAAIGGPTASTSYWSSLSRSDDTTTAWTASFFNGFIDPRGKATPPVNSIAGTTSVRAVRAGSCSLPDADGDGVPDGTDPDDDNDGLLDGFEVSNGFDPLTPGEQNLDSDSDGLSNLAEQAAGTNPRVADTDGDGLLDGQEIGGGNFTGPQQVITTLADVAHSVFATDVDGDGDVDVLSASAVDDKIAWYENTDGAGTFGPQQVITTLVRQGESVFATDVDGDGDVDVLSASSFDNPRGKIAWYENTDGAGTFGPQQVITTLADGARSVFATDVDGDGDVDVLSASVNDDKIAWYENVNVSDPLLPDTDGDGLLDAFEVSNGFDPLTPGEQNLDSDSDGLSNLAEQAAGTNPVLADTDGDGLLDGADLSPLDGADCRALNPQLRLVWGRNAPFGVDHQNDPGIGHRYVLDAAADPLPGLASNDPRFPPSLPESLRSGLQALFDGARADYPSLPATNNGLQIGGLQIGTVIATDPLPPQGTPGSPALLYIIDRSVLEDPITDPDFGPLEGFAFSGVNRFNKRCTGEVGSVFIDADTVPPLTDGSYPEYLADLVETVAHEAGHLYGLRHVLPDGLAACTGEPAVPGPTPAVMDYIPDGANTRLAHCTATPGQGCPVIEPPDCSGEDTGEDHNPLYHYLHYVVGDSTANLAAVGIVPGTWDLDSVPLVVWQVEFNFFCIACNDPNLAFYNFTLVEVLPGGIEVVRAVFSEITLEQINGNPGANPPIPPLTLLVAQSSGLKLAASSVPPSIETPDPPPDVFFQNVIYPPASPTGSLPGTVVISSELVKVTETSVGEFTTELLGIQAEAAPAPSYLIQSGGLADPSDGIYQVPADGSPVGAEDQLTASTHTCNDCFPAMTIAEVDPIALANQVVPEPGFATGLATGLAGLLALAGRRRRGEAGERRGARGV